MAIPEPLSLDRIQEIPDPLGHSGRAAAVPPLRLPDAPAPTRADRLRRARIAVALAAVWLAAAAMVFGLRPDLASAGVVAPMVAWLFGGVVLLGVVLRPRERGLPAGVRWVQHAVWIVPAAYVAGAVLVSGPADSPLTWASIRTCMALTTVMTLGPLAAAAVFLRGSFLSAPGWRGAAVGALAGLAGSIGIHAHCSCQTIGHLLAAHGTAIVLGAVAGAALGRLGGRA